MHWLLAYESTICRAPEVLARVKRWRAGLPSWADDAIMSVWSADGLLPWVTVKEHLDVCRDHAADR